MSLVGAAGPLSRGIRWRDELWHNLAGGTPGGLIEGVEIFPNGATSPRQLRPIDVIRACNRALFIGVGCDQTGIDGEALTTDEALTEGVIVAEATMLGRLGLYFLS